jgi:hypothetical protein
MRPAHILAFALGFTVAWALACAAIFVTAYVSEGGEE